jgi:hypothetical protein
MPPVPATLASPRVLQGSPAAGPIGARPAAGSPAGKVAEGSIISAPTRDQTGTANCNRIAMDHLP